MAALIYGADGGEVARVPLGRLPRDHGLALSLDEAAHALDSAPGHVELVYDFSQGGGGDGWLHALFRYRHRASGHAAETSFGAHVFNTIMVYRDEPQSYSGRPPSLSTRLFLRLGDAPYDTLCRLIYPASSAWLPFSATEVTLRTTAAASGDCPDIAADPMLRLAPAALQRVVRCRDTAAGRRRRLRGHP